MAVDDGTMFQKGIRMGTGQCLVKRDNRLLRDLIMSGRVDPSFIISHDLPSSEAVAAYDKFDTRVDGYTKVILHPGV
jgi:glutathione-independent formaldehyde dehydrogenase